MTRLLVVAGLLALFAVAKVWYDRRAIRLAERTDAEHPAVPEQLRGPGRTWLVFATEFCATCGPVVDRLHDLRPDDTVRKVMVEDDPALADRFSVRTAPTLLEVDRDGRVVDSVAGPDAVLRHVAALGADSMAT